MRVTIEATVEPSHLNRKDLVELMVTVASGNEMTTGFNIVEKDDAGPVLLLMLQELMESVLKEVQGDNGD